MKEIWKDIKGYEGLYQVSNLGNVKSLNYRRSGKEQIMKPVPNEAGYLAVIFCVNGKQKRFYTHRLVAEAFIPNPENKEQVNHIDEDKQNNRVDNLNWMTAEENINWGTHNERCGRTKGTPVKCIETGEVYYSAKEAKRQTGISQGSISKVCNGERKTAGGFHWCYWKGDAEVAEDTP